MLPGLNEMCICIVSVNGVKTRNHHCLPGILPSFLCAEVIARLHCSLYDYHVICLCSFSLRESGDETI